MAWMNFYELLLRKKYYGWFFGRICYNPADIGYSGLGEEAE